MDIIHLWYHLALIEKRDLDWERAVDFFARCLALSCEVSTYDNRVKHPLHAFMRLSALQCGMKYDQAWVEEKLKTRKGREEFASITKQTAYRRYQFFELRQVASYSEDWRNSGTREELQKKIWKGVFTNDAWCKEMLKSETNITRLKYHVGVSKSQLKEIYQNEDLGPHGLFLLASSGEVYPKEELVQRAADYKKVYEALSHLNDTNKIKSRSALFYAAMMKRLGEDEIAEEYLQKADAKQKKMYADYIKSVWEKKD